MPPESCEAHYITLSRSGQSSVVRIALASGLAYTLWTRGFLTRVSRWVNSEGHPENKTEGLKWVVRVWVVSTPRSVSRPLVLHTEGHRFKSCTAHHFLILAPSHASLLSSFTSTLISFQQMSRSVRRTRTKRRSQGRGFLSVVAHAGRTSSLRWPRVLLAGVCMHLSV